MSKTILQDRRRGGADSCCEAREPICEPICEPTCEDDCKPRVKCNHDVEKQNELLRKGRALYWNRINLRIPAFTTYLIDTKVRQTERECLNPFIGAIPTELTTLPPFGDSPDDGPGIFQIETLVPLQGLTPASRVMVIPLPPIPPWLQVLMPTEPFWNPKTGTVWITLGNGGTPAGAPLDIQINFLVWNPSYFDGPGRADPYTNLFSVTSTVNNPQQ